METSGIGTNTSNNTSVDDVLDQTNDAANQAADFGRNQAQSAMGLIFNSLIQQVLSEAQRNSSSGA